MKLGKRINILITLLITLIMVFTFFIIIPIQKEHSRITNRKIVDLMHLFITRDNHGIANAIFENRKDAIVQRMDKILTIPDVLSAFVFNSEYTILSSYSENPEISNFKKYFKQSAESGYVSWTESGSLWYLQSVVMYDEIMGYVLINYSLEDTIKKDKKNSVTIIILYLFVTIVLLMSMNIFIMEIIIKPVKRIIASMEKIAGDKYGDEIEIFSNDEIGDLASKYNEMSHRVYTSYSIVSRIRNMLENIIDSMDSVIFAIDSGGNITALNKSSEEFTGISREEAIGRDYKSVFKSLDKYNFAVKEIFITKKPSVISREQIREKYYDLYLFPLISEDQTGAVIRLDDISDYEKREEQLRQAQKMETIGNLAGGLAHDFNNVLTGIVGTASLMRLKAEGEVYTPEEMNNDIEVLENSSERAAGLVKKLLTISKKYQLEIKIMNLNKAVQNVINICKNTFDKKINIRAEYLSGDPLIEGDENQIEQVLLNICINASHAMTIMRKDSEYGGELEISIDSVEQGILKYEVNDISADKYYKITISDTGVGINQDYLDLIFDPFFTTKSNTVGSGLGLSMVYNMIKKHHGHIKVESKVGIGSTFNIYLPAVSGEQILESKKNKNADRGSGNILVIDDEEIVRNMISKMLELSGYTVYCASGGAEGLDMLDQMIDSIDLVILDMAMPEMSGDEVFAVIREKYNNVKVLLSSGFRQDNRVQKVIDKGVNGFISKPYEIKELTETVLRILNS